MTSNEELEEPWGSFSLPADCLIYSPITGYIADYRTRMRRTRRKETPSSGRSHLLYQTDDHVPFMQRIQRAFETEESASYNHPPLHTILILSFEDKSREMMTTVNQGMSVEEIERVVAQRVANAIEAIAIYKTKTNIARKSMIQTERQKDMVLKAHTTWPINKKAYAGSLPLCNQCKFHHNGPCTVKCGNCKKVGHIIQNCKTPATTRNQRTRTCYECGSLRHYKSECPIVKFQKRVDTIHRGVRASKPKTMQDAIEFVTKLMDKKISTPAKRQAENKRKLYNISKNNQNQQQQNKRQNTGRAYATGHREKKYYGGSTPLCSKCNYHDDGPCAPKCHKCNRVGHLARPSSP
ncbi:reverse transcriptase domain-containing protein [Tanacetum coccineum]